MLAVAQSTYVVALLRLLEPALRTTAERRFVNNGEIHMPAFQPTIPESACITALKAAALAEQCALELDMYSVSARVQKLLRESPGTLEPVGTPIVPLSKNFQLMQRTPLSREMLLRCER